MLRDWTESEKMDLLDANEERFFTRLIMQVDDFGRYVTNSKILKSKLFPLKTDIRETDITRWLAACEKSGVIILYSIAEKGYLQIVDFKQTLRIKKSKYPGPENLHSICVADDTQMHSTCMSEEKRREEKGREVEVEVEEKVFQHDLFPGMNPEYKAESLENSSHLDVICMELSITKDQINRLLVDFLKARRSDGKTYKSMTDLRSHFYNYCNKSKSKLTEATNKTNKLINGKPQ